MNLNINQHLTSTIAADRRRAFALEAEISRTRRNGRLARRAARWAVQTAAHHDAPIARTALARTTSPTPAVIARPLALRRASVDGPLNGAKAVASSDLDHACARVA